MMEFEIGTLLGKIYDLEQSPAFRRLRRELERHYRRINPAFRRDAYIDSMLTLLFEPSCGYNQSMLKGK